MTHPGASGPDRVVELRTYRLKPGSGARFHELVVTKSLPLLRRARIEVVAYGASLDDPDAYFLARAYDNLEHLHAAEEAFYSSEAWTQGPREEILALIESYSSVVIPMSRAAIDALRSREA